MFKKLFSSLRGDTPKEREESRSGPAMEYKGYTIIAAPESISGQYRVSGVIRRDTDGDTQQEHRFERSDTVPDREGCISLTQQKAQRFIDDVGEQMFDQH